MAKKVFAVYLAKEDVPNSEAYATLELPASPWELWDAMEKVRLKDGCYQKENESCDEDPDRNGTRRNRRLCHR